LLSYLLVELRSPLTAWTALAETDADEENSDSVIGIYTRRSITRLDRVCGGNDTGDAWNREHVWAKSHGFPKERQHAYTDIHHLVPADSSVNSDRSNYDFKLGGISNDECDGCREGDDTFEPPDAVKGQIARIIFYMDTRYEGNDQERTGTPDLTLVDRATDNGDPDFGFLSNLLEWHCKFPVTERERRRNNIVQTWQGNRNPFIDRPEFVKSIWNSAEFDIIWRRCGGTPKSESEPVATNGNLNDNDEF
jgi:serine protease